jgi:hypothetical protein
MYQFQPSPKKIGASLQQGLPRLTQRGDNRPFAQRIEQQGRCGYKKEGQPGQPFGPAQPAPVKKLNASAQQQNQRRAKRRG